MLVWIIPVLCWIVVVCYVIKVIHIEVERKIRMEKFEEEMKALHERERNGTLLD